MSCRRREAGPAAGRAGRASKEGWPTAPGSRCRRRRVWRSARIRYWPSSGLMAVARLASKSVDRPQRHPLGRQSDDGVRLPVAVAGIPVAPPRAGECAGPGSPRRSAGSSGSNTGSASTGDHLGGWRPAPSPAAAPQQGRRPTSKLLSISSTTMGTGPSRARHGQRRERRVCQKLPSATTRIFPAILFATGPRSVSASRFLPSRCPPAGFVDGDPAGPARSQPSGRHSMTRRAARSICARGASS